MRQVREILRYRFEKGLSRERIAGALGQSKGAVHNTLWRFAASGLGWPLPEGLSDSDLELRLYPAPALPAPVKQEPPLPDMSRIEMELHRKHVTVELLYREYRVQYPEGMRRSAFYRYVRAHLPKPVDMKMIHKGGDKLFVDYSGDGPHYIDRSTGELKEAAFFVAAWGASSYVFAEASEGEDQVLLTLSHEHAMRNFGCAPQALVPDNTKSAVAKPDWYEPRINPLYQKFAAHYNLTILPARIRKPKDKAVVESNVGFVQRYILGRLRDRHLFSVQEINEAIAEILIELNNEPMKDYGGQSRRERFELLDKPYAQALPAEPFRIRAVKLEATVAPNYHVRFDDHFYSVPHHLAREKIDLYQDGNLVEIYHNGLPVARHRKEPGNFGYSTIAEHMPANHRFVKGWSKEWFLKKAGEIGLATAKIVDGIMARRSHPEQGFNSALGVLNLAKKYGAERLEAACARAIHYNGFSLQALRSILEQNLDAKPLAEKSEPTCAVVVDHDNVRGADYYAQTDLFGKVPGYDRP